MKTGFFIYPWSTAMVSFFYGCHTTNVGDEAVVSPIGLTVFTTQIFALSAGCRPQKVTSLLLTEYGDDNSADNV
jgi:hypothetical protein